MESKITKNNVKLITFNIDYMVKYYFGLNNTKLKLISPGFPFSNVARGKYKIACFPLTRGLRSVSIGQHWSRI